MDIHLHEKHKDIQFADRTVIMFADIIEHDVAMYEVFFYIADHSGTTIKDIVDHVVLNRPTRRLEGERFVFEKTHTNINRKAAEKCVDHLMSMSLCYERSMKPYKFIHTTIRGIQVFTELQRRRDAK